MKEIQDENIAMFKLVHPKMIKMYGADRDIEKMMNQIEEIMTNYGRDENMGYMELNKDLKKILENNLFFDPTRKIAC